MSTPYCTDDDLIRRAPADYGQLVPDAARIAAGDDGRFDPGGRWTLRSDAVDFAAQGVTPGMAVRLTRDDDDSAYGADGDWFTVASVSGSALGLRRPTFGVGVGQPPATAEGATSVRFLVSTLAPQIEEASYTIDQLYGIDGTVSRAAPEFLYDARQLRLLCVLTVLRRRYLDAWTAARGDLWKAKADAVQAELEEAKTAIRLKWGRDGRDRPATTRMAQRIGV